MNKKSLKKLIALLSLLVVFGGLLAGFIVLKNANAEEEDPAEDTSVTVFDKGSTIITAISFKNEETELSFSYVNDDWVYDGDNNYPLHQDRVAAMASALGTIKATVTVGETDASLSDYGLEPAAVTVHAKFSDNSEKTFLFGSTNSFNNCQYFKISGDDNVYMLEDSVSEPFSADLDYLYQPESYSLQKDGITDEDISSITITTAKGQSKEITDAEGITELFDLVYTLNLSNWEDYYADSTEMAETYGISPDGERISIKYTVESTDSNTQQTPKEYTFYIGYKFEDVEENESDTEETVSDSETEAESETDYGYFYSFAGSKVVYSIDGETVDDIFEFLAYEPAAETTAAE